MIRAVAFDLDGTLIDSTDAIVASFYHTFDTLGLERPPRERIVSTIGYVLPDQFGLMTDHDPDECVRVYREHYGRTACEGTTLMAGAVACLDRLRAAGLRLGFATSKKRALAEMLLEHYGILDVFECRLGPDDVARPKPHPDAVLESLKGLSVEAHEAFFIGDTVFDVRAAQAARVRCLCVTTGYDTRETLEALEPEAVFDTLDEITDYILTHRDSRAAFPAIKR